MKIGFVGKGGSGKSTLATLFVKYLAESELVRINVVDEAMKNTAITHLLKANVNMQKVEFFLHPTNDAWCRDHGPAFLINIETKKRMIVNWEHNAWG